MKCISFFLLTLLTFNTAYSYETPRPLEEDNQWIYGQDINSYSCVKLNSINQKVYLQVMVGNRWINKVKGVNSVNRETCGGSNKYIYVVFNWIVDVKGQIKSKEKFSKQIKLRLFVQKFNNNPQVFSKTYVKNVYSSMQDWDNYIEDLVIQSYNKWLENELNNSSNSGYSPTSKLGGCVYKNKQLFGKVQIVDYGADFKIQLVEYGADLKVRKVDYGATKCGVWQFVEYGSDFKVQIVEYGSDFKVQFVEYGEGL